MIATEAWSFDTTGRGYMTGYDDARGQHYGYGTDMFGRRVQTTVPSTGVGDPVTWYQNYYNDGSPKTTTDLLNRTTTVKYDGRRQPVRTLYADGSMTSVAYDAMRNVAFQSDELGNVTGLVYDERGRQTAVLRADGASTIAFSGGDGRNLLSIDALGRRTESQYDPRGRLIKTILPAVSGGTPDIEYFYDVDGNVLIQRDPLNRDTVFTYTARNQVKTKTEPDPNNPIQSGDSSPVWSYVYDLAGNLTREVNPLNHWTEYAYDGLNRQTDMAFREYNPTVCTLDLHCLVYDTHTEYDNAGNVLSFRDPRDAVTTYVPDARNRVKEKREPEPTPLDASDDRPLWQYAWDAMNNLFSTIDPLYKQTNTTHDLRDRVTGSYTYDGLGNQPIIYAVSTMRDAAGRPIGTRDPLQYDSWQKLDAAGRVVESIDARMQRSTTTYDAVGNVNLQTDVLGRVTDFDYDNLNRLTKRTDPDPDPTQSGGNFDAPVWQFGYDLVGNQTTVTDPINYTTYNDFDRLNRLASSTTPDPDPADADTSFVAYAFGYDKLGNRTIERDPYGFDTINAYNSLNQLVTKTQPDAVPGDIYAAPVWTKTYDVAGNLLSETDPTGVKLSYEYDKIGRLFRKIFHRSDATKSIAFDIENYYDRSGNVDYMLDENGKTIDFTYDSLNRRTQTIRPATPGQTHVSSTAYLADGSVFSSTDETGLITWFRYDAIGRQTFLALPHPGGARTTRSTYDAAGNLTKVVDPLGNATEYAYDGLDRRVSEKDALGYFAYTTYDKLGNVTQVKDRNNNVTDFTYTKLNRVKTEVKPGMTGTRTYEYNRFGGVTKYTDRNGRRIERDFDRLNRPKQERWYHQNGTTLENTIDWQYNNAGQIENVRDDFSVIDYDYGDFGRMYQALNYSDECLSGTCTVENTPNVPQVDIDYTYDNFGDRKTLTGSYLGAAGGTTYTRDDAHRLTNISRTVVQGPFNYNYTVGMTYDQADRPTGTTRTYVNNVGPEAATQPTTTLLYETGIGRLDKINFGGGAVNDLGYDDADRITSISDSFGTHLYTYSDADQLTYVDNSSFSDESYTVDANGNMSPVTSHNKVTYDANGGNTYTYDNEGNVTGILLHMINPADEKYFQFVYDQRNRLTRVNRRQVSVTGTIEHQTNYTYDALDRRIIKNVAGAIEKYAYDGDNLYLEFNGANTLTHRYLHGDAVDSILADENLTVAGGDVEWQMTNHEGSVERIRKGSNGSERSIRYRAFGVATDAAGGDEQFSYTGREFDEGVGPNAGPWGTDAGGMYYLRARYYDPTVGRFLSQDPSGFSSGDVNLYRYAENDPVRNTDRFGLQATSVWNANLGSASLSTLDFGSSRDAFFAREQARLANELQGAGLALARDAFQQEFIAQPEMMLPLDVTPVRRGDDFFTTQIDRQVREMFGDRPSYNEVPLTPMQGERLRAQREYVQTDNRRMAIEALGYNSVNYTRADRIRLDREAWRNSAGLGGAFSYSVYMNARFVNDNEHQGTGTAGQESMRASQDFLIDKSMIALDAAGVIGAARATRVAGGLQPHSFKVPRTLEGMRTRIDTYGRRANLAAWEKGLEGTAAGRYAERYFTKAVNQLDSRLVQGGSEFRVFSQYGQDALGGPLRGYYRPSGSKFLDAALTDQAESAVYSGWDVRFQSTPYPRWNTAADNAAYVQRFQIQEGFVREISVEGRRP